MGIEALLRKQADKQKLQDSVNTPEVSKPTQPTQPTQDTKEIKNKTTNPSKPIQDNPTQLRQPTQPIRDFTKYPNSVSRNTKNLFRGMNKDTYDKLYSLTRASFPNPSRFIQIKKIELEKITGFSDNTLAKHLKDLQTVGLIKITHKLGNHEGSIYEVLIPEELPNQPIQLNQTNQPIQTQKLGANPSQKIGLVGTGEVFENKEDTEMLRFKFKDLNFIDDETLIETAILLLNQAAKTATGKNLTSKDLNCLQELFELLINETDIARTRTKSISSYVPFAVENLRRRLYTRTAKQKTQEKTKAAVTNTDVGKYDPPDEPEALSLELRETVAESMQKISEQQGREAIEIFKKSYTTEDWNFIKSRIVEKE